jgi:hypothetical protein
VVDNRERPRAETKKSPRNLTFPDYVVNTHERSPALPLAHRPFHVTGPLATPLKRR